MRNKQARIRKDQLKPVNVITTIAIAVTTLFTPIVNGLPSKSNLIHAETKDEKTLDAPNVNKMTDQDTNITGIGEKGTTVKVVVDGQEIGTGKVDEKGNFKVDIPKQPVGKEIVLTLTDVASNTSQPTKRKIEAKDEKAPDAPNVNKVTDQDINITGIGEKGTTVKVVVDGQEIGTGKVDEKGNFKVDIPKQSVGKEIVLTLTDVAGNMSQPTKRKIEAKDEKAPDAPSVNKVTDQDTNITGIGEKEKKV
ncbi:Ig-like domain-containing protein, partial [Bacillus toyonensis]|uniref:Ig-like domain-containing protein n=1 Tax=Bacillus toyonensis TaxID=155322 RepID=UPI003D23675F